MLKISLTTLAGGLLVSGLATAATKSFDSNPIGLTSTNWTNTLALQKFDPALGTLTAVTLTLYGDVRGNLRAESEDAAPALLSLNLAAQLTMTRPDGTTLTVAPSANETFNAAAYDGDTDFSGTSGVTFRELTSSVSNSATFTDAALFAPYIGLGSLSLPVSALGNSSASGSGNIVQAFSTQAGAMANVAYEYTLASLPVSQVPEPSAYALMLAGVACVGVMSRRSRRR